MPQDPSFTAPQKRGANPVIWIFFALFSVIIVGFMLAVGYYLWQIQYGDREALAKRFQKSITDQFSRVAGGRSIDVTAEQVARVVRPHNPVLGEDTAPLTIVAFIDFECPFCQRSYPTFTAVTEKYSSAVRVVFKHLPLSSIHPNAGPSALAASCAHEQGAFWPYYHKQFRDQLFSDEAYQGYAAALSLDVESFNSCYREQHQLKSIEEDIRDAASLGVRGTPTYFLGNQKIEGVISEELWNAFIIDELQQ